MNNTSTPAIHLKQQGVAYTIEAIQPYVYSSFEQATIEAQAVQSMARTMGLKGKALVMPVAQGANAWQVVELFQGVTK